MQRQDQPNFPPMWAQQAQQGQQGPPQGWAGPQAPPPYQQFNYGPMDPNGYPGQQGGPDDQELELEDPASYNGDGAPANSGNYQEPCPRKRYFQQMDLADNAARFEQQQQRLRVQQQQQGPNGPNPGFPPPEVEGNWGPMANGPMPGFPMPPWGGNQQPPQYMMPPPGNPMNGEPDMNPGNFMAPEAAMNMNMVAMGMEVGNDPEFASMMAEMTRLQQQQHGGGPGPDGPMGPSPGLAPRAGPNAGGDTLYGPQGPAGEAEVRCFPLGAAAMYQNRFPGQHPMSPPILAAPFGNRF